ncbi:hypothetical protein GCM10009795_000650 [Nocardioides hankookensis]
MMLSNQSIDLAIILVNYGSYASLDRLLGEQTVPPNVSIVVVDNTPHEETQLEYVERWRGKARVDVLIASPENVGYMGGARYAVSRLPWLQDARNVAVANTDLMFDMSEYAEFFRTYRPSERVGVIAPRLVGASGAEVRQLHYLQSPTRHKYERLGRMYRRYPIAACHRLASDIKRNLRSSKPAKVPGVLFAPHGAMMIFTRAYLDLEGAFEHPAFLFCEEAYVGATATAAGLTCIFEPSLKYSHENHGSMGWFPSRRIVGYLSEAHTRVAPLLP